MPTKPAIITLIAALAVAADALANPVPARALVPPCSPGEYDVCADPYCDADLQAQCTYLVEKQYGCTADQVDWAACWVDQCAPDDEIECVVAY